MEFLKSENPPCHVNSRKKGYIQVMKDLWDKKRYEHLGLKSQNLRDHAARLEKINAAADRLVVSVGHERHETEAVEGFEVTNDCPVETHAGIHEAGRLPDYVAVDIRSITIWGRRALADVNGLTADHIRRLPNSPTQNGTDSILSFYAVLPSSNGSLPSSVLATIFTSQQDNILSVNSELEDPGESISSSETPALTPTQT
ncbi:Hypothetical predicted protein [Paramuricea clavata]|uniref:Uncharacterized protein n=1 Tax=Paramuricea clavata TaxID=317549 RepID=A0A7D9L5N8_PARCT|nr:Hypothetical predicted protein [Paramuricea clavata]